MATSTASSDGETARNEGELDTRLNRTIGTGLLFLFILGDMVGGGIYALVGEVGGEVGGAIWTAFAVSAVLAFLTAMSYAELTTKYPLAAGAALYAHKAFRTHLVTFMVAFAVMMSGLTSAGALARAFAGDYFGEFLAWPEIPVALGLLGIVMLVNLWGISQSVRINATFTLIEIVGLLLIVVIGVLAFGDPGSDVGRNFRFKEGTTPFFAIVAGVTLAFYALIGFEDSANVAEETKRPSRAFPRALIGGFLTASAIYILVSFMASLVVATDKLANSSAPLLEVVKEGPLGIPPKLFSAIGLFALTNGALINMIMGSRLLYGMANQRVLPGVFGSVLPGRRTPWVAILFTTAIVAVMVVVSDLEQLATTTVMLLLAVFVVVNISVLVLRRDRVEHAHFRTWTPLPVLAAVTSVFLITQNDAVTFLQAGILLGIGLLLWVVNRLVTGPPPKDVKVEELAG
jgi:basic amino acid/polyamine antiporter, APA family